MEETTIPEWRQDQGDALRHSTVEGAGGYVWVCNPTARVSVSHEPYTDTRSCALGPYSAFGGLKRINNRGIITIKRDAFSGARGTWNAYPEIFGFTVSLRQDGGTDWTWTAAPGHRDPRVYALREFCTGHIT